MSSRDGSKDSEKKKVCRLGNISYDKTRNIIISAEVAEQTVETSQAVVGEEFKTTRMIVCDTSHCLRVGNYSSVFSGTFGQKVVAVERIMKDYTEDTFSLPDLLTLNHANLVKVLHIEDTSEFRYYATESSQGSMDQLFLEEGHPKKFKTQMPSEKNVLLQLADGLDYIHSTKQLVHGDIRPENVFVFTSPCSGQATVKWAGFGLLKTAIKVVPFPLSKLKGSMNWMAPELLNLLLCPTESTVVVDQVLADIYSAGCTFFFYLSRGRHPFGNHSISILSNAKLNNPVNAKVLSVENFAYSVITEIMLAKEPEKRKNWIDYLKVHAKQTNSKKENQLLQLCSVRQLRSGQISTFHHLANDHRVNVNCHDLKGRTPLMLLSRFHFDCDTFLRCLDSGLLPKRNKVDVTLQDVEGNTALHSLCFNGRNAVTDVMKRFVRRGIQVNCTNKYGYNALHSLIGQSVYGCGENLVNVVRYLVKCGLEIHAKTDGGDTVLTLLCDNPNRYDFMDTLHFLVTVHRLDLNHKNSNGVNALHCLSQRSCNQLQTAVQFLIKSGADVKSTTGNGDTILHLLCRHSSDAGLLEIVRVLVIYLKMNVNQTNNQGENALHCLCSNESDNSKMLGNVFLFLVENGVNIRATTKNGVDTAWSYLCRNQLPPITLLLLFIQQGIDIHSRDSQGDNCLHQLCRLNSKRRWFRVNVDCVRLVIDAGIDINSKTENGVDNALHVLCRLKSSNHFPHVPSIHVLRLLIENGINVRALDVNGDSALHLVCRHSGSQMLDPLVRELVKAGADIHAKGSDGLTAINILWNRRVEIGSNAPEIIDYLVNQ